MDSPIWLYTHGPCQGPYLLDGVGGRCRTPLPFTYVRPTSARNHFSVFVNKKNVFTLCFLLWEDRQVRRDRFYNFNEKHQRGEPKMANDPRLDFVATFASFGILWARFGSCWVPFLIHVEFVWVHFFF